MRSLRRRLFEWLPAPIQPVVWRVARALRARRHPVVGEGASEMAGRRWFFRCAFKALTFNGVRGDYVEFGSGTGATLELAYRESRRFGHDCVLWTFDSFAGFPEPRMPANHHPRWLAGRTNMDPAAFRRVCRLRGIPLAVVRIVPGFFKDTLLDSSADLPRDISLAYLDCDLYSSTREALAFLLPRLKHGMLIACDDYFCWSAEEAAGERRALAEAFPPGARWRLVPYVQFGWHGMSFLVERAELIGGDALP